MSRNKKLRHIGYPPLAVYYKPQGMPMYALEQVNLHLEEYEAIRLADYESLKHEEAAERMEVSRPTFTRILESAHKKIADALINGKAIRIEGGNFILERTRYYCKDCGFTWITQREAEECPTCKSDEIINIGKIFGWGAGKRRGWRRRHGQY